MKNNPKDAKLIELLKKNSRASNTELAREVGLSEGAVRQRIKSLIERGTIKRFTIETGSAGGNQAVVLVKAKGNTKRMMKQLSGLIGVKHAYEISGSYDACIIITADNMENLDTNIDLIRSIPSVADTRTFISLKEW